MPKAGSAGSKKAKDGSCGVFGPSGWNIHALKGGNTRELWEYTITDDSWVEKEPVPLGTSNKKVKTGADIVAVGNVLYATKGNKQNELWVYVPGAFSATPYASRSTLQASGVMREASGVIRIGPNPLTGGVATIRLSPSAFRHAPLALRIYDATGRCVQSGIFNLQSEMALDLRGLRPGVYLVRLDAGRFTATHKLVVQK
jgi:hypothetical protein